MGRDILRARWPLSNRTRQAANKQMPRQLSPRQVVYVVGHYRPRGLLIEESESSLLIVYSCKVHKKEGG